MTTLPHKIRALRRKLGLNQTEFGELIGVVQSQVSKWEREAKPEKPALEHIEKLAHEAKMTVDEFLGISEHIMRVPVVGYVGAGAEMILYSEGQGDFDIVDAPKGSTKTTVAAEIRGDSLGERLNGWLVFYDNVSSPPADNLIGKMCVVGLEDGRVLVKGLERGQRLGHYNLHALVGAPIYDAKVTWAAKVLHFSQDR